jgi:hypothetical protein
VVVDGGEDRDASGRARACGAVIRVAALVGLSASLGLGCKASPLLVADGATADAMMASPGDGGDTTNVDVAPDRHGLTPGCGADPNQLLGTYVEHHISIAGPDLDTNNQPKVRDRTFFVRLPANYDRTVPYRVVYQAPGCGGSTAADVLGLYTYSMNDAILVALMPLPEFGACFDESVSSVEYPFFDALHKQIEGSFCVDPARQFEAGFSTGARLGYMLDCTFPDVLRATATIQGGLPPLPACKTNPIAMFVVADTTETGSPYGENVAAAQRVFAQNGCSGTFVSPLPPAGCGTSCTTYDTGATPLPAPTFTPACVSYVGCPAGDPVVFCTTMNSGKTTLEPWVDQAFWNFIKQF